MHSSNAHHAVHHFSLPFFIAYYPGSWDASCPEDLKNCSAMSLCCVLQAVGVMKEGQIFTIEPMVNMGTYRDMTWPDGWTSVTADGKRSAQFEHTLLVTASGCEVLTRRLPTSPPLWWEAQ